MYLIEGEWICQHCYDLDEVAEVLEMNSESIMEEQNCSLRDAVEETLSHHKVWEYVDDSYILDFFVD